MPSIAAVTDQVSPFTNLNSQFESQNGQLESLLRRLQAAAHRLSDTNFPKEESPYNKTGEDIPFNDGHLKSYYYNLQTNMKLISLLGDEVVKLESLI